jgi:hypothetical protein
MAGVAPGVSEALVDVGLSIAHAAARTIGIVSFLLILLGVGLLAAGILFGMARRASM